MNKKQSLLFIIAVIFIVLLTKRSCGDTTDNDITYQQLNGRVFNTFYHITYAGSVNYHDSIRHLFDEFDGSLSMFNDTSIITRINRNDTTVRANHYFTTVFNRAKEISAHTAGAFDMTIAPLVNLWGFGFKNKENVTDQMVDSLLPYVGFEHVHLDAQGRFHKTYPQTILDASSIAKGYMCDVIAQWLQDKGVTNYMIEIGGEIALNGHNRKGRPWSIGINAPVEDSTATATSPIEGILYLTQGGVATSGNYRNFYYKNGRRYAHTIDPKTGYPIQQDILSSTVIAQDCMTADAYATAFMVMGSAAALELLAQDTTLMAYFIVEADSTSSDDNRTYDIIYSPSLQKYLSNE